MKIKVPFYYKSNGEYKRSYADGDSQFIIFQLDTYIISIQTIDDVKKLVQDFKKPTEYVNFVNNIKTTDLLDILQESKDKFKQNWSNAITGVPLNVIDELKPQKDEFLKLLDKDLRDSMKFLKNNVIEIENLFKDIIEEQQNKMKQSRKDACKRYYLKKKQEINASFESISEITEEEQLNKIKQSRSEANKKYYLKKKEMLSKVPKKVLTDEEKYEKQKQYSKKYYDTHKKVEKPEKTEEQLKKAEIKRKYYLSNKELKKQNKELLELIEKQNA